MQTDLWMYWHLKSTYAGGKQEVKRDEIPYPCNKCENMKPWNLHMNGDHDYACRKKPSSKYGDPGCDRLWLRMGDNNEAD